MLTAAVIGCGRMGGLIDDEVGAGAATLLPYGHAGAYRLAPGVRLVAAADLDAQRCEAFCDRFGIPGRYGDHREMLATVHPDIVSVTVPATARARVVIEAARAGVRGVYAEKALCCSLGEADAIEAAFREAGTAFNIGTSRRYHPSYRAALGVAAELGGARLAAAYAAGGLMHTHSHTIDTLLFLLGDPGVVSVSARLALAAGAVQEGRLPADPAVEWAVIDCAGGLRAALLAAPGRYEFEVVCPAGAILAHNNGRVETWRVRRAAWGQPRGGAWAEEPFPDHDTSVSPTLRAVLELVGAVREGTPTSGGMAIARRQMEVGLAMALSHLRGGVPVGLGDPAARDLYVPSR